MPVPPDPAIEPDYLALPDAPTVCIFESADARTILLATTASARELARRRLTPAPPDVRSLRPDLRSLCCGGMVHAIHVGSSLEADAVYLHQARTRTPHLAKVASERWRAWFAHVNPDDEFPQWTKTNLMVGLVGKRKASSAIGPDSLPPGIFLGPLPDKDAAGRFIETMIDTFDLCRFHNLLVQAPKAAPCAYKEMGRCPAPCDGTETMPDYRRRTREAADMLGKGLLVPTITRLLREGVAFDESGDGERARPILKRAEQLGALRKSAFSHVASLHDCALLLFLPSPVQGHIRVALAHRGRLLRMADIDPADAGAITQVAAAAEVARANSPPLAIDPERVDTIALTTRWLFLPEKKRRGEMFRIDNTSPDPKALQRAARSILLRAKPGVTGDAAVETHEIEP